mmetsp:Transcript_86361/g.219997  ORF Transcript_86361/g.219997 Transcript_86361/m.219997 type:complete len:278 (+) Transcript_86361:695-1528(+)
MAAGKHGRGLGQKAVVSAAAVLVALHHHLHGLFVEVVPRGILRLALPSAPRLGPSRAARNGAAADGVALGLARGAGVGAALRRIERQLQLHAHCSPSRVHLVLQDGVEGAPHLRLRGCGLGRSLQRPRGVDGHLEHAVQGLLATNVRRTRHAAGTHGGVAVAATIVHTERNRGPIRGGGRRRRLLVRRLRMGAEGGELLGACESCHEVQRDRVQARRHGVLAHHRPASGVVARLLRRRSALLRSPGALAWRARHRCRAAALARRDRGGGRRTSAAPR